MTLDNTFLRIIRYLTIFMFITTSGGNFIVRNIYVFVIILLMLLSLGGKLSKRGAIISIILAIYITVNTFITNTSPIDIREYILCLVRIFGCYVVYSNFTLSSFKNKYVNIMEMLAIMSLFWFLLICIGIRPPFTMWGGDHYASLFQTVGFTLATKRNSGIFAEPGLYQIFLNIALLMLVFDKDLDRKKYVRKVIIFSITIISTLSSMGILIYLLVIVIMYLNQRNIYKWQLNEQLKKKRKFIFILAAILFVVIEYRTHLLEMFITNYKSYSSRHDDTLMSIVIALEHPLFGIGLCNNPEGVWMDHFGVLGEYELYHRWEDLARSNGLGNCLFMGGIPFTLLFVVKAVKYFKYLIGCNGRLNNIIIALIVILMFMEEPYMMTPFFMLSFWGLRRLELYSNHKIFGQVTRSIRGKSFLELKNKHIFSA